jgi:uncharacterized protein (TIGR02391 family)
MIFDVNRAGPFASVIPDALTLLNLEPEEIANLLLQSIRQAATQSPFGLLSRTEVLKSDVLVGGYPQPYHMPIRQAFAEAWVWLEREGLLVLRPEQDKDIYFISRRGMRLASATDIEAYRKANLLPRHLLHPVLAQRVYGLFLRGDYDIAILQAFKDVEIAVRKAGKLAPKDLGTDLMRKAFAVGGGPLADSASLPAEQQALSDLFSGAIGLYKNPQSHRNVSITDPVEAIEILMIASHLLQIVDVRSKNQHPHRSRG